MLEMIKENKEPVNKKIEEFVNELRMSLQENPSTMKDLKSALLEFRKTNLQNQSEENGDEDLEQVLNSIVPPGLYCCPSSDAPSPEEAKTGLDVLNFILGSGGIQLGHRNQDLPPLENVASDDEFQICTRRTRKEPHTTFQDNTIPQKNAFELLDTSFEIDPVQDPTPKKKSAPKRSKASKKKVLKKTEIKTLPYTTMQLIVLWSSVALILTSVAVSLWSGHVQQFQVNQTIVETNASISMDYGRNATVDIAHPVPGSSLKAVNEKLIWNINGLPATGPRQEYPRVVQCTVYMNDIVIYANILRLANESPSIVTLNLESKQETGDYNATVALIVPLDDGTERLLTTTSLYTVDMPQPAVKVTNPLNGTLFVENQPLIMEFSTPEAFKTPNERLGMMVKFDEEEYTVIDTTSTSITISGMSLGKHTAAVYLLQDEKILFSDQIEFQVLGWTDLSEFSTAALRNYLTTFQLGEHERGLIESVLDTRFEQL